MVDAVASGARPWRTQWRLVNYVEGGSLPGRDVGSTNVSFSETYLNSPALCLSCTYPCCGSSSSSHCPSHPLVGVYALLFHDDVNRSFFSSSTCLSEPFLLRPIAPTGRGAQDAATCTCKLHETRGLGPGSCSGSCSGSCLFFK